MSQRKWRIEWFDTIGSTNAYLLAQAQAGAAGGLVAIADHQSAGRGRLDRTWESPPGTSLLLSVLVRERLVAGAAHLLTAAMALAGAVAAERVTGLRPGLKWPNDLVIDSSKLAGVLAEADASAPGGPPGSTAVVIGMGMNLSWPGPPEAGGTSLEAASGHPVNRDQLVTALLDELGERLDLLESDEGRTELFNELTASLVTLGQAVGVTTPRGVVTGVADRISPHGLLVVMTEEGEVEIAVGDVEQLRPG
jgi:BirA family biotin operon repressor/biotin-[acetyl-CoA-carboxylase] ligase